jgi:hypothetical protein
MDLPSNIPLGLSIEHVLAPLRNKLPGAGHSRGLKEITTDDEIVELAINLAAAYISFLIKRFKDRNP